MSSQVEAVVVNYNSGGHLKRAVDSLLGEGVEKVWVVNNSSVDGSCDFIVLGAGHVEVIDPGKNLGYGRAANLGFGKTGSKYVIICNPDIEVEKGSVSAMVDHLEADIDLALVGPRIINPDGSTYPSVRAFPSLTDAAVHSVFGQVFPNNKYTKRYRMVGIDHSRSFEADWVSGAFFMVRSAAFKNVGGFNSAFFMYMEDVYLCRTLADNGYKVGFCGSARVRHVQGATTSARPLRMIVAHHRALWTYAAMTKGGWRKIELLPIGLGIIFRLIISLVLAISRHSLEKPKLELD